MCPPSTPTKIEVREQIPLNTSLDNDVNYVTNAPPLQPEPEEVVSQVLLSNNSPAKRSQVTPKPQLPVQLDSSSEETPQQRDQEEDVAGKARINDLHKEQSKHLYDSKVPMELLS